MGKKRKEPKVVRVERPKRQELSEEETIRRMESFEHRKERFIAAVRKGKN